MKYQDYYGARLGSATLSKKAVFAGQPANITLTYKAGELGVSAGLKVLFQISSDVPDVQFDNPKGLNFVQLESSNKNLKLEGYSRQNGLKGKVHERPWTNGFIIFVKAGSLIKDQIIKVHFKNFRMQTYVEDKFEFRLMVDPFSTDKYIKLPSSPTLQILSDNPKKLKVIAPSTVTINKPFKFLVKLEDKWGNPCSNVSGKFEIQNYKQLGLKNRTINFSEGFVHTPAILKAETPFFIEASYSGLKAISNPVYVLNPGNIQKYWADLHWQSNESVGTNTVDYCLDFIKKYALIDVSCIQPNDFELTNDFWHKIKQLAKRHTKNGEFVFFAGYEWSGESVRGGDRNVLFLEENPKIYRSSHALLDDLSDADQDLSVATQLFSKLKKHQALTIAHVGGRPANLKMHDDSVEPLVEIHSDWGTFEWFYFDALKRGYEVGVVANSDNHNGRPGASYPGFDIFDTAGGLTCILAKKLDKKSIFQALSKGHCYATTGARINLDIEGIYHQNGQKKMAAIGEELPSKSVLESLKISCTGTSPVEKIEIFNNDKIIYTEYPELSGQSKLIKISWQGYVPDSTNPPYPWNINLAFSKAKINNLQKMNIYHHTKISQSNNGIQVTSETNGNTQGLLLKVNELEGKCKAVINCKAVEVNLAKLSNVPKFLFQGAHAQAQIYMANPEDASIDPIKVTYDLKKSDIKNNNAVFVKVTQKDGQMAWTSPIFF